MSASNASQNACPLPLFESNLRSLQLLHRGKVRDIYGIDEQRLLIVQTDRLSAFDVILPTPVPGKGEVLTALSNFWFRRLAHIIPNHLLDDDPGCAGRAAAEREQVAGRAFVVRRLRPLPIEAIVRGYLAGSGWKEYQTHRCDLRYCACRRDCRRPQQLPQRDLHAVDQSARRHARREHRVSRSRETAGRRAMRSRFATRRSSSTARPRAMRARAASSSPTPSSSSAPTRQGSLYLIDEALTPDSSRFWPVAEYRVGSSPPSFDKQYRARLARGAALGQEAARACAACRRAAHARREKYREALASAHRGT